MKNDIFILGGGRTPLGSFLGSLSSVPAPRLGAVAIKGALEKSKIKPSQVEQVIMGNVIGAGVGQAPARQAAIFAELGDHVPCVTLNKVCGSGMAAVIQGSSSIKAGDHQLVVAGGMENMSLAPFLLPQMRMGQKFGAGEVKDSMQWDGLWDVYSNRAMGNCAEECAKKYGFSRQEQDEFSINSFKKAQAAIQAGIFKDEITPVTISSKKGDTIISEDEGPFKAVFDKIPKLPPVFEKNGTITAANASTINDGAAAIVLGGSEFKNQARFRIVSYAGHAQNPTWFTTAPIEAIKKSLKKANLSIGEIDLFEINEAFAVVTMAAVKELELDIDKVNIFGGGISLGHPIGCSGARIIVTLMNGLEKKNKKLGLASLCIGGGEALSLIIEKL